MSRTGFLSRCSRFGIGLGALSVSRGYGPLPDAVVPGEPDGPVGTVSGARAPSMHATRRKEPKVLGITHKRKKSTC